MNKDFFYSATLLKKKRVKVLKLKFPKLKRKQVLVKIIYSSICRSQIMEIDGKRGKDNYLPHLLGHEGVGVVEKIGRGVKEFKKNDIVIIGWMRNDNHKYYSDLKFEEINSKINVNYGPVSTFGNYSVIAENRLVLKPINLNLKLATLFGCAILTGAGMVINQAKPKKNDRVLVLGLGAIGLSAVAALKCLKVKNIIAIDSLDSRLIVAKKLGATKILNIKKNNLKNILENNFDFCFESAGNTKTIELGFEKLKSSGQLFFASHPKKYSKIRIDPHEMIKGKKIFGSWGGQCVPKKDVPKIFNIFYKNKIKLSLFISKIYKLNQINTAIKDFKKGNVIRPLIKMEH
jgi:S-(hydroxymethyl)glutathione dehydrogenase/alcohol dehydrogenase